MQRLTRPGQKVSLSASDTYSIYFYTGGCSGCIERFEKVATVNRYGQSPAVMVSYS